LNVVPIYLPPLRERREDIIPLAEYFLQKMCEENHKEIKKLTSDSKKKLLAYNWPGNTRELANIIERAVVMDANNAIAPEHLYIDQKMPSETIKVPSSASNQQTDNLPVGITLQELEKRLIIETLQANRNNRTKTAETLGISIRTLRNKLHEYNLPEDKK
jgi:two-component system response regulator AtoC